MDQYRLLYAADRADAERAMNEVAAQGYRFVAITTAAGAGDRLYVVMEYVGGRAGTVQSEALQAGIPSQGPTAERQFSEDTLGSGRL